MINAKDRLSKKNAVVLLLGLAIFAISFLLTAMIGIFPEGALGFFAPLTMLIGVITITLGFLVK